ncbi:MAG: serine hydrolase domain-containing protein [Gemmatimonadota bacterium]
MRSSIPNPSYTLLISLLLSVGSLEAQSIRSGTAAEVGLSQEALDRIAPRMQQIVDAERTGGIMTLVARDGVIAHWAAVGWRTLHEDALERTDVFRIYSMTKPIASTAVMMLVEEGRVGLDQPVGELLPRFAEVEVYDDAGRRAPTRPITIRDLLRHTSGLTYGVFGNHPVDLMYRERLQGLGRDTGMNLAETADAIAELPLLSDPGTQWVYSLSTDVLGRVVEVASGMSFDAFLRSRIFEPLGMDDTGFHVAEHNLDRFTGQYGVRNGALAELDSPVDGGFVRPPSWFSGGGGLTSTAMDYLRFAQMLLNDGELDGVRILRSETVQAMRSNQLPEGHGPIPLDPNARFGLGFAVDVSEDRGGLYYWSGVANTWFWIDPIERIVALVWTQSDYGNPPINPLMRGLVYDAIEESNRVPVGR